MRLSSVDERLSCRHIKHISKLIRRFGDNGLALQRNKVIDLHLATDCISGMCIDPGEYFLFYRLVGRPNARHDFAEDVELSFGKARSGIGGNIYRLSNLVHWIVPHSPLRIVERVSHSFDPLPDEGRILPFGPGAAISYDLIDLVLHNPTADTFQLRFHIAAHRLKGELLCSAPCPVRYHAYEGAQCFARDGETVLRLNEIQRGIQEKDQAGTLLASECLYRNRIHVKYPLEEARLSRD